jgi:hypothetical protein
MTSIRSALASVGLLVAALAFAPGANAQTSTVGWYIGTGLGFATGAKYSFNGSTVTFGDHLQGTTDKSPLLGLNLINVGATLSPNWMLGFTIASAAQTARVPFGDVRLQINNYLVTGTWFPAAEGFFLRGGAGWANIQSESPGFSDQANGTAILFGLGYALPVGISGKHHITFTFDHSRQSYGSSTTQPEKSQFSAGYVGYMYRN